MAVTPYKYLETAVASGGNECSGKMLLFSIVTKRSGILWRRRRKHRKKTPSDN